MKWFLKKFNELSNHELYALLQLRVQVFVVEQLCTYQDMDNIDLEAWHLFAVKDGKTIAYARLIPSGISYPEASIGRVIVDVNYRKNKIGKELMIKAIENTKLLFNTNEITISAQVYLLKFYSDLNFKIEGEEYLEDNIPHIKMKLILEHV